MSAVALVTNVCSRPGRSGIRPACGEMAPSRACRPQPIGLSEGGAGVTTRMRELTKLGAAGGTRPSVASTRPSGGSGARTVPRRSGARLRVGCGCAAPHRGAAQPRIPDHRSPTRRMHGPGSAVVPENMPATFRPHPLRGTTRTWLTMTIDDETSPGVARVPGDVVDPDLWRWGIALADQHRPDAAVPSRCRSGCHVDGESFPCRGRASAERLLDASRGSWPCRWTARLDALSCGLVRPDAGQRPRSRSTATDESAPGGVSECGLGSPAAIGDQQVVSAGDPYWTDPVPAGARASWL